MIAGIVIVAAGVSGRLWAWWSAKAFTAYHAGAFSMLGKDGTADTAGLKLFFEEEPMGGCYARASALRFLGGGYASRLDDLKTGSIYISEQYSLPEEKRFMDPPALSHLKLRTEDRTNQGLGDAAGSLILECRGQLLVP